MDTYIDKDKKRIDDFIMNLNANLRYFSNLVKNNGGDLESQGRHQANLDYLVDQI